MLTENELHLAKAALPEWHFTDTSVTRHFEFTDFRTAFAFITEVALISESINHHPRWYNNYNIVDLELTTHSENSLTSKDIELANAINDIVSVELI